MKESEYLINTASASLNQTFLNAEVNFRSALLNIKASKYNFEIDEDLPENEQIEKYTEKNHILYLFAFAYENYIKYLLQANKHNLNPRVQKSELWGSWIRDHKMEKLYFIANEDINNKIDDFENSLLKVLIPYYGFNGFGSEKPYFGNNNERSNSINLAIELDPYFGVRSSNTFDIDLLREILIRNNELFIKARYSGEEKTNYNFKEVYCFLQGIKFFANLNFHNNNKIPENIEIAYIKEKLLEPDLLNCVHKYRTDEEIKQILELDICKESSMLAIQLLSSNSYKVDDINKIIKLDESFKNPNFLLRFIFNVEPNILINHLENGKSPILFLNKNYEHLKAIYNIPVIGEYFKKNPDLFEYLYVNTDYRFGLSCNEWIELLSLEEIRLYPDLIESICKNLAIGRKQLSLFEKEINKKELSNDIVSFEQLKNNIKINILNFSNNNKLLKYFSSRLWMEPEELNREGEIIKDIDQSLLNNQIKNYDILSKKLASHNIYRFVNGKWENNFYEEYVDELEKGHYK